LKNLFNKDTNKKKEVKQNDSDKKALNLGLGPITDETYRQKTGEMIYKNTSFSDILQKVRENIAKNTALNKEVFEEKQIKLKSPSEDNDNSIQEKIWDDISVKRINKLHPLIREDAKKVILEAQKEEIYLRVTYGMRTFEEQNELYNKGRDKNGNIIEKSKVVTNAKGGQSYHNYGLAFDVVEIKDGEAVWDTENWNRIGKIGINYGFEWGGNWEKFKDRPHFQNTFGLTHTELLKKYNEKNVDNNGYVIIK
jgi:peptidoglycan L-alanyl-D-glutamate endopeptidase CwlK